MGDFSKAFEEGKLAAVAAEKAKKEIESVIAEMDQDLSKASGGKIRVKIASYREKGASAIDAVSAILGSTSFGEKYYALEGYNPNIEKSNTKKLARWSQGRLGYPCKISWENIERICEDRTSLEHALKDLLRDPVIAERLNMLIELENLES